MIKQKEASKLGGDAAVLNALRQNYTTKQFKLISRFLEENPRVTILSGG